MIFLVIGFLLVSLLVVVIIISRSFGYYRRKDEDNEKTIEAQKRREDISARPDCGADDILKRMREESWDK